MIFVVPGDERISDWVAKLVHGTAIDWGNCTSLAIIDADTLVGGVVFSDYRPDLDVRASIATSGPGWATRRVLRAMFDYPFNQLGVKRITCLIAKSNQASRTLCEKLGFKREGSHPLAWEGIETAISYGITKPNCRWI